MSRYDLSTAWEADGVYWITGDLDNITAEMSVREQGTPETPLSRYEEEALALIREALASGALTEKELRRRGKIRKKEMAIAASQASPPEPAAAPEVLELRSTVEALRARLEALEASATRH